MATIESYVTPQRLYRYRSLKEYERELEAIEESYMFCSAYEDLNDPMEGLFTSSRLLRKSANHRAIRDAVVDRKSQIGLCSFSEVYDNGLMWAHYADQFRGICIAYRLSHLLECLSQDINFVRMYYNEMVPTIRQGHWTPKQLAKMVLSYKNYRWLYEREWRMFARQGRASYRKTNCISCVYFGARINPHDRSRITAALKKLHIKTMEMEIDEYFISFRSCS
jgi:hypothetical protein